MERAELSHALRAWLSQVPSAKVQGPRLISETDPQKFMAAFAAAVAGDSDVFLCDPNWGENERAQLTALLAPPPASRLLPPTSLGWLMIPTGGSSGRIKFARHDQNTIAAAVNGFSRHFGLTQMNAVGVLPLHHVSGLMAWLRCALTGGAYHQLDWKAVETGTRPKMPAKPDGWVLSLVPTQLERLLRHDAATTWLKGFRIIFLGGAPAWPDLCERAAARGLPLAPGYGMTETAAMVTALRPDEFLAGGRSSGAALPHARLSVAEDGTILVAGGSLFRGFYPEWRPEAVFKTADTGRLDEQGRLHVTGRRDDIIISGGEKVNPAEVEAVLRDQGGLVDVVVVGLPDAEWGQVVVAAYPVSNRADAAKLAQLTTQLTPAKRPKQYFPLESWPLTGAGKVNRAEVARLVGLLR